MQQIAASLVLVVAVVTLTCCQASLSTLGDQAVTGGVEVPLVDWTLASSAAPDVVYQVKVPSTVVGGLVEAGTFSFDPFYGKNIDRFNKTDYMVPWIYRYNLSVPTNATGHVVVLRLDGINYKATLRVGGQVVADDSVLVGAFRRHEIDITAYVAAGSTVALEVEVVQSAHDPREWRNNSTDLGISFDDWAPHPPDLSMGLWRPVSVVYLPNTEAQPPVTMDGLAVGTLLPPAMGGTQQAYLNVSVVLENWGSAATTVDVWLNLGYPGLPTLELHSVVLAPGQTRVHFDWTNFDELQIQKPQLWWPWQMGGQTMFHCAAGIYSNTSTGKKIELLKERYGIRQVSTRLTDGGALQFYVNRVPLLIRAGGWAPDLFLRNNISRIHQQFRLMRDMNMNGVRLEGKMEYRQFFESADETGILILPGINCCDGWQHWSRWTTVQYKIAHHSMRDQARRLSKYPSVAGFLIASDELPPPNVEIMYDKALKAEAWPNPVISSASQEVSTVSGPSGVKMVGPYSWEPPNYWLDDGNGLKDFNAGGAWGFFTEGGPGEAPMTLASWKRTVPEDHLWSDEGAMDSWWSAHMGCPWGHFRNLTFFNPPLLARYGSSNSAEDYLYKSQAMALEGIRSYFESYNRNKHKNATGFVQWMMNDALPTHLWHLYDWYLVGGGGYYAAKRSNEALHAMMSYNDGTVWLINSLFEDFGPVTVTAKAMFINGTVFWSSSQTVEDFPADATLQLSQVTVPLKGAGQVAVGETFFVQLTWKNPTTHEELDNWYWLTPEMDITDFAASNGFRSPCTRWANFTQLEKLSPVDLTLQSPGHHVVTNSTKETPLVFNLTNPVGAQAAVAFLVHIRLVDVATGLDLAPQMWSDNFFSIAPGATKRLSCDLSAMVNLPEAGIQFRVIVETYNDVVGEGKK